MKINKKKFLLTVEKVFTVVSLLLYSGGILTVILSGGASEGDNVKIDSDSSLIQLIFLLIYLVTCLMIRIMVAIDEILPSSRILGLGKLITRILGLRASRHTSETFSG